ncbi:MAG: GNAT family N-acetyltransferase [Chloroflexi bacterium]|nr:GNAT family N-acetyltransferase [Chloroflexota bacterium]
MRSLDGEEDYWRIRAFLRDIFMLNECEERTWQVARLDYWRWHVILNCDSGDPIHEVTRIWETVDGKIVAVLNAEGRGEAFLQIHPHVYTAELVNSILRVAEKDLVVEQEGQRKLTVWVNEQDTMVNGRLQADGYKRGEWPEHVWSRSLDQPVPEVRVAEGYEIRPLARLDELPARSWASWRAFHPHDPDEKYEGWDWYLNIQRMPLYRRDLDIVAVAPNGDIAAFSTLWFDDVTRCGYFEPVGTAPEHQRRGLGKAVMLEAMRRMQHMGGTLVTVGGYTEAANGLYKSVMTQKCPLIEPWQKVFRGW